MQCTDGLDALLDSEEPHATFHDAELHSVQVDYRTRELVAMWRMCVGDPDAADKAARERRREAYLTLPGSGILGHRAPNRAELSEWPPMADGRRSSLAGDDCHGTILGETPPR
jgi:hypothetical protein